MLTNVGWFLAGLAAATLLCVPIFVSGRRVTRLEGGAMVAAYLAYLTFLLTIQS